MSFARASLYGFFLLAAVSWGFITLGGDSGFADLFEGRTWDNAGRFLESMIGVNSDSPPAYAQPSRWLETGKLAANTLAMSMLAIGMAGAGAFVTLLMAARNVSDGTLGGRPSAAGKTAYYATRTTYTFSRAIPELALAMMIVFFLSPGILPGAVALGLHNYGILGRLTAEVVENLDPAPARANCKSCCTEYFPRRCPSSSPTCFTAGR
jgi:phosphonate transport system permease protein